LNLQALQRRTLGLVCEMGGEGLKKKKGMSRWKK